MKEWSSETAGAPVNLLAASVSAPSEQTRGCWQTAMCNSRYMHPRERLLQDCHAYFLKHGVANLSLRPLAASVGTSARMLIHHFGSKEGLISAVMERIHAALQESFSEVADNPSTSPGVLLGFWRTMTSPANRKSFRLLLEVQALAIQNPRRYRRYLAGTSSSWRELIERSLPRGTNRTALATLSAAVIDGLLLELLSTGDLRRTTKALQLFAASLP
jgi:AcrR family transcriptional regulator